MTLYSPSVIVGKTGVCVPEGADGVTVTGAAAWVDGAYAQVDDGTGVPAAEFVVSAVALDTPSAAMIGEIVIASGAGGAEVDLFRIPFEIATDAGNIPVIMTRGLGGAVAASTRIAAQLATSGGGNQTIGVKLVLEEV